MTKRPKKKRYTNTAKGGYSRDFTIEKGARPFRYVVVSPRPLWRSVQAKAKVCNISIRALILGLLARWVNGDIQHPPQSVADLQREYNRLNSARADAIELHAYAQPQGKGGSDDNIGGT